MTLQFIHLFDKKIELYKPRDYEQNHNIITILVGKNSSGKSTALAEIISELLEWGDLSFERWVNNENDRYERQHKTNVTAFYKHYDETSARYPSRRNLPVSIIIDDIHNKKGLPVRVLSDVVLSWEEFESFKRQVVHERSKFLSEVAPKIIAISNTVYNRFPDLVYDSRYFKVCPSKKRLRKDANFRIDVTQDIPKLLINLLEVFGIRLEMVIPTYEDFNSIWNYFLLNLNRNNELISGFKNILSFLGCINKEVTFCVELTREVVRENSGRYIDEILFCLERFMGDKGVRSEQDFNIQKNIASIYEVLDLFKYENSKEFSLDELSNDSELFNNLSLAIEIGLISTTEVYFPENCSRYNIPSGRKFADLSSGEISFLTLGILLISSVVDNSVICIDEPEINLHPEWQEKLINFFQMLLEDYRDIQLIIATHSPQIVSNLPKNNAFIANISSNETLSAREFINKSADFQLTKIFQSPGHNNEYLLRKLLILITRLSDQESYQPDESEIDLLEQVKGLIRENKIDKQDKVAVIYNLIKQREGK